MELFLEVKYSETNREKLIRLRRQVEDARENLIDAEAELAEQMSDLASFEGIFDRRVGQLGKKLASLEDEIKEYNHKLQLRQNLETFGSNHIPVEEQYKRRWKVSEGANGSSLNDKIKAKDDKELKRLFRKLARRFHPDLARDAVERAYRTEKMSALNDAYAARSLVEMSALASLPQRKFEPYLQFGHTESQMMAVLQLELDNIQRRMFQIQNEMENHHNHDIVELSLRVKLARRSGRDLLGDMAFNLQHKILKAAEERDKLRSLYYNS
jgi:hypothetical protein